MDLETHVCTVCGLPLAIGDWPCVVTIRPHAPSLKVPIFTEYFDWGLGEMVTSLAQRWRLMHGETNCDGVEARPRLEYRDKMSPGDQSARLDRIHARRKEEARG